METPLLAVTHASKSYNGIPALIDASLELRPGEVHALMGENGAGKSTLIKLLAGVLSADSLHVAVSGQPVTLNSPQAAFRHGLRFIHQELNVVPQLTVAENIYLSHRYPSLGGVFVNWRRLNKSAGDLLHGLGINHLAPRRAVSRLSPGDQMLVKIAAAFVGAEETGAAIYVMDEPTAALSGAETEMLFNVIAMLKARGAGVVYVSHRMDEIFRISDRITVMRDGRVVAVLDTRKTSPAELVRLMTGREIQNVYPPRSASASERVILDAYRLRAHGIEDISFRLAEGEILGVAGLAGSGRSELLRALVGASRLTGGELLLDGQRIANRSPSQAWRRGLAYVPEERRSQGLVLSHTIKRNIVLPHLRAFSAAGIFTLPPKENARSRALGETVSLRARGIHQKARQLSGGNQQKVVFARALARSPRLLLLDEPTRGVDVGAKYDIYNLIRRFSASGTGIIMVSSELAELIGMCDRILILRGGRMVDTIPAAGQTEESLLNLCYGESLER
jgi:ribose transport system ATP-binding protein